MDVRSSLRTALFLAPLLLSFIVLPLPERPVSPTLILGISLCYARLAAFIETRRGTSELFWALAALPFGLAGAGYWGGSRGGELCLLGVEGFLIYASILVLESRLVPRHKGFALVLGFCLSLAGALSLVAILPPALILGASGLILSVMIYSHLRSLR